MKTSHARSTGAEARVLAGGASTALLARPDRGSRLRRSVPRLGRRLSSLATRRPPTCDNAEVGCRPQRAHHPDRHAAPDGHARCIGRAEVTREERRGTTRRSHQRTPCEVRPASVERDQRTAARCLPEHRAPLTRSAATGVRAPGAHPLPSDAPVAVRRPPPSGHHRHRATTAIKHVGAAWGIPGGGRRCPAPLRRDERYRCGRVPALTRAGTTSWPGQRRRRRPACTGVHTRISPLPLA